MKKIALAFVAAVLALTPVAAEAGNNHNNHQWKKQGHSKNYHSGKNRWHGKNYKYRHKHNNNNNNNFYNDPNFWWGAGAGLLGGALLNNQRNYYQPQCYIQQVQVWDPYYQTWTIQNVQVCN